jgi:hypothetical protein
VPAREGWRVVIVKLEGKYIDWQHGQGPLSQPLDLEAFKAYWRDEYGRREMFKLDIELGRVEAVGTSHRLYKSAEDSLRDNHAGVKGKKLSIAQLVGWARGQKDPAFAAMSPDEDPAPFDQSNPEHVARKKLAADVGNLMMSVMDAHLDGFMDRTDVYLVKARDMITAALDAAGRR